MIRITTPDVVARIAEIEGDDWAKRQKDSTRQCSVAFVLTAVLMAEVAQKKYQDSTIRDLALDIVGSGGLVIYGAGGWNRYTLDAECNVIPIASSFVNPDRLARAVAIFGRAT